MKCPHCAQEVKLNEIVRSAYHVLGCVYCYGKPEAATPIMVAERVAGAYSALTPSERARRLGIR